MNNFKFNNLSIAQHTHTHTEIHININISILLYRLKNNNELYTHLGMTIPSERKDPVRIVPNGVPRVEIIISPQDGDGGENPPKAFWGWE